MVFLIGYRGCGKSTVGRLLAERLGWESVDSDDEIERRAGKSIAAIFADDGEPAFRDSEERVIAELCDRQQTVVALGGGAVLRESTRRRLQAAGPVVWLTAPAETLAARISGDTTSADRRPSLLARDEEVITDRFENPIGASEVKKGASDLEEVRSVLADREPIYRECANLAIDAESRLPEELAEEIADWLTRNNPR